MAAMRAATRSGSTSWCRWQPWLLGRDRYRDQCRISDAVIVAAPLTAAPVGRHPDERLAAQTTDLRRIILHMIEETARHAGQLMRCAS